jgi:hypothetical protein
VRARTAWFEAASQQRDLAEGLTGAERADMPAVPGDIGLVASGHVEAVARVALLEDGIACRQG